MLQITKPYMILRSTKCAKSTELDPKMRNYLNFSVYAAPLSCLCIVIIIHSSIPSVMLPPWPILNMQPYLSFKSLVPFQWDYTTATYLLYTSGLKMGFPSHKKNYSMFSIVANNELVMLKETSNWKYATLIFCLRKLNRECFVYFSFQFHIARGVNVNPHISDVKSPWNRKGVGEGPLWDLL